MNTRVEGSMSKSSSPRSRSIFLLIQKIARGKVQVSVGHFHSSLKIHTNIIFSAVKDTRIARTGNPFTFAHRRGWRTKKWGSSANASHSRVICTRHYHVVLRVSRIRCYYPRNSIYQIALRENNLLHEKVSHA